MKTQENAVARYGEFDKLGVLMEAEVEATLARLADHHDRFNVTFRRLKSQRDMIESMAAAACAPDITLTTTAFDLVAD